MSDTNRLSGFFEYVGIAERIQVELLGTVYRKCEVLQRSEPVGTRFGLRGRHKKMGKKQLRT